MLRICYRERDGKRVLIFEGEANSGSLVKDLYRDQQLSLCRKVKGREREEFT